jgi:hypothetical protein
MARKRIQPLAFRIPRSAFRIPHSAFGTFGIPHFPVVAL